MTDLNYDLNLDSDEREPVAASATAAVCDNLRLFGGRPDRDEPDSRDLWDEDEALTAVQDAFDLAESRGDGALKVSLTF